MYSDWSFWLKSRVDDECQRASTSLSLSFCALRSPNSAPPGVQHCKNYDGLLTRATLPRATLGDLSSPDCLISKLWMGQKIGKLLKICYNVDRKQSCAIGERVNWEWRKMSQSRVRCRLFSMRAPSSQVIRKVEWVLSQLLQAPIFCSLEREMAWVSSLRILCHSVWPLDRMKIAEKFALPWEQQSHALSRRHNHWSRETTKVRRHMVGKGDSHGVR